MAKATQSSKPTKDATQQTEPINLCSTGSGIGELATQLADIEALSGLMGEAEGPAEKHREKLAATNVGSEEHVKCCRSVRLFAAVSERSYTMAQSLQELILSMEPTSIDETLSLAAVFLVRFDSFASQRCDRADRQVAREIRSTEGTIKAIIRGLVAAGATSPILDVYTHKDDLVPWAEARTTATCEANLFAKVAYDPVRGQLRRARP